MTPDARAPEAFIALLERTFDLGDVAISGDLERDQAAFGEAIAPHLKRGAIVIALGGGHEIAFGHFLGYVNAGLDVSIHNWDAHPDVRPLAEGRGHSGSPFRQALEHPSGRCKAYTVAGLLPHAVASAHIEYMRERGARAIWRDEIDATKVRDIAGGIDSPTMATFDLDAVDQSEAPGVSAPGVGGMSAELWLMAAEAAGRNPNVKSMDVVELNPSFDIDGRTARLAALTVWRFMKGLASRRVGA